MHSHTGIQVRRSFLVLFWSIAAASARPHAKLGSFADQSNSLVGRNRVLTTVGVKISATMRTIVNCSLASYSIYDRAFRIVLLDV
jgi:hypothetical protein